MVALPTTPMLYLLMGGPSGMSLDVNESLLSASGSWGGQIADGHLPVGHEAARGNAASPSGPDPWDPPAMAFAADMGV